TLVPLRITIEFGPEGPTVRGINSALTHIFLVPGESLTDLVPKYWKDFLAKRPETKSASGNAPAAAGKQSDEVSPGESYPSEPEVFKVGKDVIHPDLVSKVEPTYTPEALAAKLQGTVILNLVVGADGKPFPDIQITEPLGLGLDESAIDAVRQWRFSPGTKDG